MATTTTIFRRTPGLFRAFHTSRGAFAAAQPLNSFVAAMATPRPTPPSAPPSEPLNSFVATMATPRPTPPSASVPFMITGTQRQKLYGLGFTREDVDALSPSDALDIIGKGLSHDAFSARVRATWRPKKPQITVDVPEVICLGGEIVGTTAIEGKSTQSPQLPATASAESPSPLPSSSPSEFEQYRRRRPEEQRPQ